MSCLVIAEHDNKAIKGSTLKHRCGSSEKSAATSMCLWPGAGLARRRKRRARSPVSARVLHADAAHLADFLAENVAAFVVGVAKGYTHILAPATSNGKNVTPRVAALLDMQQISEIGQCAASACSTLLTPAILPAASAAAPDPLPATSTWTSPPIFAAAATVFSVEPLMALLSCSAMTRQLMRSPSLHCAAWPRVRPHRPP